MRAQSTSSSTYTSGLLRRRERREHDQDHPGSQVQAGCGLADGADWSYGTRTLQVTITRLDGLTSGSLAKQKQSLEPSTAATR